MFLSICMSLVKKLTENRYGLDDIIVAGAVGAAGVSAVYNPRFIAATSQYAHSNYLLPGIKKILSGSYDTLLGMHKIYYGLSSAVCNVVSNVAGIAIGGLAGIATYAALVYGTYKSAKFTARKLKDKIKEIYQKIKSKN